MTLTDEELEAIKKWSPQYGASRGEVMKLLQEVERLREENRVTRGSLLDAARDADYMERVHKVSGGCSYYD